MFFKNRFEETYRFLTSTKLAIGLFAAVCLASIPGTFSETRGVYGHPLFVALFALLGLNLAACTSRRIRTLSRPVLILHLGVMVILIGAVVSSTGFVATVNIYEGKGVDRAFRWDREEDMPLGMNLAVTRINAEYHPVPVKVGVLNGRERSGLFELRTGESFSVGGYRVRADALDPLSENLALTVYDQGRRIGEAETGGRHGLPRAFPYRFVLVAYKNPSLKRVWVDLVLSRGENILAQGISEVNHPFEWEGLRFYHTGVERDLYGNPYAGIQITRDPGRPVVEAGFAIVVTGALLWTYKKIHRYRKQ